MGGASIRPKFIKKEMSCVRRKKFFLESARIPGCRSLEGAK